MVDKSSVSRKILDIKVELADKSVCDAKLSYYPKPSRLFRKGGNCIEINIPQLGQFSAMSSDDYFTAFCDLREQLEIHDTNLLCWGAREDVWPSEKQLALTSGLEAHELPMGQKYGTPKSIFEYEPSSKKMTTVQKQALHSKVWHQSNRD